GGEPEPETEKVTHYRMEFKRTVGLMPMEKNGDRNDGDVSEDQGQSEITPERQVEQAGEEHGLPF
ncbi:MAG: hypothetical protein KZQ77_18340, partial [Candidatus Thiodiazotropha sp. (ex Notomyrtea botanica)]|nr:hypothetical protein [Candidatus Thiodiazotropha sp. (ex Notomyrtea botanica)]